MSPRRPMRRLGDMLPEHGRGRWASTDELRLARQMAAWERLV